MAKKVFSAALHTKKKALKKSNKTKKLKTVLKNVFNYMKSDTYMFAPLVSSSPSSFGGEMTFEPFKKQEMKKLAEDVKDYLKCDCYMYAPLGLEEFGSDSANHDLIGKPCGKEANIGNVCDQMEPRMKETTRKDVNTLSTIRDSENEDDYSPNRRIVVKHNLVQKETVKHIVHQNCLPSSVPGRMLSPRKTRRVVAS